LLSSLLFSFVPFNSGISCDSEICLMFSLPSTDERSGLGLSSDNSRLFQFVAQLCSVEVELFTVVDDEQTGMETQSVRHESTMKETFSL
jgi:hypothetical protein